MHRIEVMTPAGPGIIWGIGPGKVLVEMDYSYPNWRGGRSVHTKGYIYRLVEFESGDVERIEREGER